MEQTTIFEAIAAQERAFARIEQAECYEDWKPIAEAFVIDFAASRRGEWTGEDLTDAFLERGLMRPRDLRWFGPIFKSALARGVMHELEGRGAPRRRGHGTAGARVYRSGKGVA